MPRFRVSYTFTEQHQGDEDAIRKAIRGLSFGVAFEPGDINAWSVGRTESGEFLLNARRTLAVEIYETSERAALRKFLYSMDLPDVIELGAVKVERVAEQLELAVVEGGRA
jgi:hypothetical protein